MKHPERFPRLTAVLLPLLLVLAQAGCGDDPPDPIPDAGTQQPRDAGSDATAAGTDAGTDPTDAGTGPTDAGTDAGTDPTDAGTDPVACPFGLDAGTAPQGDPDVVADTSADILVRLRAVPGLTVEENPNRVTVPQGYRFFLMTYDQPADHARPECQRFPQRLNLLHTSDAAPMVLYTGGYGGTTSTTRRELTRLLGGANQLSVEHRFFKPSRPEPADWSQLTIQQSAADFHRIVQALKPIYTARWLSTGSSKGGETVVFHRRFYPDDVDATVAYVAPLARPDDERFPAFQETVGGPAQAACRDQLRAFQRRMLGRRPEMLERLQAYATGRGLTYSRLGFEKALEHAIIETYFALWQYGSLDDCSNLPGDDATTQQLLNRMDDLVGVDAFSDNYAGGIEYYDPYYYQASLELGWPKPYEAHLSDLLLHPGTDVAPEYLPPGLSAVFRPQAMQDIQDWVSTHGERLMFIYGELDPWTSAAFALGNAQDSFLYIAPGGNHGSGIGWLTDPDYAEALATVRRWAGLPQLKRTPARVKEPQFDELAPRLPPRLRPPAAR